jgi:UDP-N-acetylmuramoyl-tripeptide--D-alanyl-D-alanine ligase
MMANLVKKIILWKLRTLTALYLRIKKIEIVAITGSAGKTTAKVTIGQIIPASSIYVPAEAYNTEYGVPLAMFREKIPANPKSLCGWIVILSRMFIKLFLRRPFSRIVLEYGADKPGDIAYLTSFARPHIALVTTILPVHLEGFKDIDSVTIEKTKLVTGLGVEDFAILNADDNRVLAMSQKTRAKVITFGKDDADILYSSLKYNEVGMSFDITWKDNKYEVNIPVVAPQLLPSYLGALAVGIILGEDPEQLIKKLSHIEAEHGRMNVLKGTFGSIIIDDSYNSNPESAKAALDVLSKYTGHKIAVLGSMNELGKYSIRGHEEVAEAAATAADEVIVIGEIAGKYLYPVAQKLLNKEAVKKFTNSSDAGKYLKGKVKSEDVILFKGSQNGVFVEEAIKYVLAVPEKASELLVRQGPMWQKKKGVL